MKILFLTCWYPTEQKPVDGVFILEHARAIKVAGHDVTILALPVTKSSAILKKKYTKFTDDLGIETHLISIGSYFHKFIYSDPFYQSLILNRYIKTNFKEGSFDLVHSNILYPCAIAGDRIAKKLNIPHVITEHWSGAEKFLRSHLFSSSGKKTYKDAKAITTVSQFLKNKISPFVADSGKVSVVPNVVDTSVFAFAPKNLNSEINFTAIAMWNRFKRPMLIAKTLNSLQKEIKDKKIVLNFVGEGEYLDEIKKMKWDIEIVYHGTISKKEVAMLLHKTNFLAHASTIETFSLVIAEALTSGTPVIASNVGAIPELVNEQNGVLCENTEEDWLRAVRKLLQKEFDHKKISQDIAGRFSKERIGENFSAIYSKLKK